MVLRRPYAFLIKHFRMIHLIITGFLLGILFKFIDVYNFLNDCIVNSFYKYNALEYVDYKIYMLIGIVIFLLYVVSHLLKYKNKPRKIYMVSILCYLVVGIFMFVSYSYLTELVNGVIDQKVIRLYRDMFTIIIFVQSYFILLMFIRGLGFDIKKFNFNKDLQELNLNSEDSEEVEVNLSLDTNTVMRGFRKQKREFGYFFKEYKIFIITILAVLFIYIGYKGYNYFELKLKVYKEGDLVGNIFNLAVKDSYFNVYKDDSVVIVSFDIYKMGKDEQFNTGNINLVIGNKKYPVNKNICYKYNKLGNCYKRQYIIDDATNYILVFEVDKIKNKNAYFVYNESYDNVFKVKLDLDEYKK